ncbi:Stp1/IreP family PP2C-type Ser/Thr phosphatase [Helcobacillus sp. ACRRO]|uniref:Stp1/IreP family PP2C-type Ser/Thr phosphatase n=1 Tax=Helcobacillus sp. ACRRO TaxID=2918202 RepID=UPI001EF5286E|nr:Stp1/IreP family PP2C-type Ser/Thr phosphatase [Helcobacillus sp. ACRRO]MCG7427009.1 Stp1/IreP family PP2C-type Ser/Thr phosphatase [Helcobacillus sp. ACRRO]
MTVALHYAARTDVGLVRSNNQDSGYAGPHLLVVADGMGGHAGGDVASSLAIARLIQLEADAPATDIVAGLETAILEADRSIVRRAREEPLLSGMGTTVTALLRAEGKFALAHIGDSRAYVVRDGETHQVTKDHTFVQRLIDEGRLTPEEAERHPQRSIIMRVLGDLDTDPELDLSLRPANVGDRWLLCSDGLSGVVSHDTIDASLREIDDVEECADHLIELALRAGGPDNITAIVADVVDLDQIRRTEDLPSTKTQVVGAAAIDRNRPTQATGPAARAAALTRESAPYEDEDFETEEPPRRGPWPAIAAAALLAILLTGAAWFGYSWTQDQYYVGTDGTTVQIYRGVPQDLGPISLSSVETDTGIPVKDLRPITQTQVKSTIVANDLKDAERIVAELKTEATPPEPSPSPTPSASPTPSTSATPSASPSAPASPSESSPAAGPAADAPTAEGRI